MKILMVDDERGILEQGKLFMGSKNDRFDIDTVLSAEKALEMIENAEYDVIVSDYKMPGMDGLEFLEEIREVRGLDIPFIVFTGRGREKVAMEALNLGADRYFQKGGDPTNQYEVLAQTIEQEFGHWKARGDQIFFDELKDPVIVHDLEGNFLKTNKAFHEKFGYSEEKTQSMSIDEIEKEYEERVDELVEKESLMYSSEYLTKDEESYSVEVNSRLIGYRDQKAILNVIRDVSRRREAKEKLKESEESYRRLFETAQDGMLIIDAETGIIEDANPFIQDILGYSKEELVGKELWELGTFESVVENKRRFEELVEEGYIRYEDKPLVNKDGKEVPVEFVSNSYEAGEKKVVQCNIREISQRKRAEEALSSLVRSMSKGTSEDFYDSVVEELCEWLDMDGAFIGKMERDEKVTSLSMMMDGEKISDYQYALPGTPCGEVTGSGACAYRENVTVHFPEDEELVELGIEGYVGMRVEDESEETLGVLWAVSKEKIEELPPNWEELLDILARRTATEIEREKIKEQIKEERRFLNNLLQQDINNNVGTSTGFLQLIDSSDLSEENKKLLGKAITINKESYNLVEFVRETINSHEREELIPMSANELLMEAKGEADKMAEEKGVEIEIQSTPDEMKILGGPELKKLLPILIKTSIRRRQCNKMILSNEEKSERCIIKIEDDGERISKKVRKEITTEHYTGSTAGFGGPIYFAANIIAENYGGSMKLKDSDLGGVRFEIHLERTHQ